MSQAFIHYGTNQSPSKGQILTPFGYSLLGFCGFIVKDHIVGTPLDMNSYKQSGFQSSSDMNPKFEFNTPGSNKFGGEKPVISSMTGLSKPRMVKSRKSVSSKSMGSSESRRINSGYNPFRPVSDGDGISGVGVKSGVLDDGGGGGGVSSMNYGSRQKTLKVTSKDEKVGNELINEIRRLRIENQNVGGQSVSSLDGRSVGLSGIQKQSDCGDNGLQSKLPDEMKGLNLGVARSGSSKVLGGMHGGQNVGGSFGTSLASELPNVFKCLNLKDSGEVGGRSFVFGAPPRNDFVFGSNRTKNDAIDHGVVSGLPDSIKNLKIEDPARSDGSREEVNVHMSRQTFESGVPKTVSSSSGVIDTMVLDEMEKVKLGGASEGFYFNTDVNASSSLLKPSIGGMGEDASRKLHPTQKVSQVSEQDKHPIGPEVSTSQSIKGSVLHGTSEPTTSSFPSSGLHFQVQRTDKAQKNEGFGFGGGQEALRTPSVDFRIPQPKANLFTSSNMKMEFSSKKGPVKGTLSRGRKGKVKDPHPVLKSVANNFSSKENSSDHEYSESYSPMDVSPYRETQDDAQSARPSSLTTEDHTSTASQVAYSTYATDEDLVRAAERMDINESNDSELDEANVQLSDATVNTHVARASALADCASAAEAESFKSALENLEFDGESEVESKCEVQSCDETPYFSALSSVSSGSSFMFAASSSSHGQTSGAMHHQRKKNRMKAVADICISPRTATRSDASSSLQFSPTPRVSVPLQVGQNDDVFIASTKGGINLNITSPTSKTLGVTNGEDTKKAITSPTPAARAAQEACEKWRLRGNQTYANGNLEKAEDYYTQGLSCIPRHETSRDCLRSLVLCYSNRAATRMSLGRMREALQDCLSAAEIDPNFFRVQLRAANCYLALGNTGDASQYFKKLLQSTDVCVERKIIVEASDGLQKTQKVSECIDRSSEFLRRRTDTDVESALGVIAAALVISPYSEHLLQSKAEALFMLRKYEDVIQLCEQTLEAAGKNFPVWSADEQSSDLDGAELLKRYSFAIWRYGFIFKSNFFLGKLEEALEFLEKQENWRCMVTKYGNEIFESLIPQLSTTRELIRHKSAGNAAFQAGRHTEAVEHYTAALSFNVESRPFAAVCFGNRAAAYQALGQITDAIADCSLAIALDGNYLKALSRRATLFETIRDYDQAAKDLERLVSLLAKQAEERVNPLGAPVSMSSIADLRQARQRLYQMEEQTKKGIPLNVYLILGLEPSVTAIDLKKAYRKAALRHHPDKASQSLTRSDSGDDGLWKEIAEEAYKDADKLFKMVGEAYAVLSDPNKRSLYDMEEEMRNGQKKNSNSMSRMHTEAPFHAAERGGSGRQWREGWRSANPYSRGFEPNRPGRYH